MAKTIFADGDIVNKLPGTRVLAAFLNKIFNHRHDGGDVDGSAPLDYAVDSGAENALVAALTPALPSLIVGMPINIQVAATNTGATTLNLNALGVMALKKLGGTALAAGDLQANQIITVAYDGDAFQLLSYNSPPVTNAQTLQGQSAAMLCPPGIMGQFFMPTVPSGWLPCDGRAVLRAQYLDLYAAIGTTWGAGDNITTFNLPEVRGEFFRAWDNGRGVDADRVFGSFQGDQLAAHTHTERYAMATGTEPSDLEGGASGLKYRVNVTQQTGSTGGTETRPRNVAVLVCIKY